MDCGPSDDSHKEDIKQQARRIICALVSKGLGKKKLSKN